MNPLYRNKNLHKRGACRSAGFSLVEILIVLALIGLLATLVVTNVDKIYGGQKEKTAKTFVTSSLEIPLQGYFLDVKTYPTSLNDLIINPGKGNKWKGPYLKYSSVPKDPWDNDYHYVTPAQKSGGGYDVWSSGPDGQNGTADDIGNWGE